MPLTSEQQDVVDAVASGHPIVKVAAGAGTGKTSTLEQVCRVPAGGGQTYTQFSKAGVDDASRRFPSSVDCRTSHSLAWQWLNPELRERFTSSSRIGASALAKRLGITRDWTDRNTDYRRPGAYVNAMMITVRNFCYSEDDHFMDKHVPLAAHGSEREHVLNGAWHLWERDITQLDGVVPFTHDHYQKLWSLAAPPLRAARLLLDEAQDTNPCVGAVVKQQNAQLVIVGDSNQALYEWRGARDYLSDTSLDYGVSLPLTGSFRFGPEIADVANVFLGGLGSPMVLRGLGRGGSASGGRVQFPDAILCRTNAGCIRAAVSQVEAGRRTGLAGKTRTDLLRFARGGLALRNGRQSDHPDLVNFRTWEDVREYAEGDVDGAHMRTFVRLVERYGERLASMLEAMTDGRDVDVQCSTVWKAKGLQWPAVGICADFQPDSPKVAGWWLGESGGTAEDRAYRRRSFLRVSYVAVTRPESVLDWHNLGWVQDGRMLQDGSGWGQDGSGI